MRTATLVAVCSLLLAGMAPAAAAPVEAPLAESPVPAASAVAPRTVELSGSPQAWTALRSGAPDSADGFGFDDARWVGQCVGEGGGAGCAANDAQRVAYDFGNLGAPEDLKDGVVRSATLTVPVDQVQGCLDGTLTVHNVTTGVSPVTTWTSTLKRWIRTADVQAPMPCSADGSDDGLAGSTVELDVTRGVRAAVNLGWSLAFGLAAPEVPCRGCDRVAVEAGATLSVVLDMTDVVEAVEMSWPPVPCVVGDDRPGVHTETPTLGGTASNEREPFPTNMSVVFTVRALDSGELVWQSEPSTPQGSGASFARNVPPGYLEHGRTYSWSIQAVLPSGRLTEPATCEFYTDFERPENAPDVTPLEGYPAVYAENTMTGGPFVKGAFLFGPAGADDVAYYLYGFEGVAATRAEPGEVVEFLPTSPGGHYLRVYAVDGAGNLSPERIYDITVAFPVPVGGFWRMNDGAGLVASDATGGDDPLALTGEDMWGQSLFGEYGDPDDHALVLDAAADEARTDGPVVSGTGWVTVAGWFKPAATGRTATVVSQGSTFSLGEVVDPACSTASGSCWAFTVATGDGSTSTTVYSDAAPVPGRWHFVAAVRNGATGEATIQLCDGGTVEEPGEFRPRVVGSGPAEPLTTPSGAALTIGGSGWTGTVDHLRVLGTPLGESDTLRWCFGA